MTDSAIRFEQTNHARCAFAPEIFEKVVNNLIKNPNITTSHLFRADILYNSETDLSYHSLLACSKENDVLSKPLSIGLDPQPSGEDDTLSAELAGVQVDTDKFRVAEHLQPRLRPRMLLMRGFTLRQTVVRELIPRNPQLDRALIQTCHFYDSVAIPNAKAQESALKGETRTLVVYLPHVDRPSDMPFYHPTVKSMALLHAWHSSPAAILGSTTPEEHSTPPQHSDNGAASIYIAHFSDTVEMSQPTPVRLTRTLQNLHNTIIKHGTGLLNGYTKRVNHDQLIPQARFQDTYTRLKLRHARSLVDSWREVTDPTKHVFEDIGIAAFLIELWHSMYDIPLEADVDAKSRFPGFVDIGCGNGVLVHILTEEGYRGVGIDIRARKSWDGFPVSTRARLSATTLVPAIFAEAANTISPETPALEAATATDTHNGIFPPGTFLISNHADELTLWTPLLAYLSSTQDTRTPWLAIPCCSHDVSGARTRFPPRGQQLADAPGRGPVADNLPQQKHAAETGTLGRRQDTQETGQAKGKPTHPSAYSTLCERVENIAAAVGYVTEREMLRIPSTRNVGIVGRGRVTGDDGGGYGERVARVTEVVDGEMRGRTVRDLGVAWRERAGLIARGKGCGH